MLKILHNNLDFNDFYIMLTWYNKYNQHKAYKKEDVHRFNALELIQVWRWKKNTWCKARIEQIINNSEARLNEQKHLSGKPDPKNISTIIQVENLYGKLSSAPAQFPRRKNLKAFLLRYLRLNQVTKKKIIHCLFLCSIT